MSSQEFYGAGYDDSDKRIPDMTIINKQLGMIFFSTLLLSLKASRFRSNLTEVYGFSRLGPQDIALGFT